MELRDLLDQSGLTLSQVRDFLSKLSDEERIRQATDLKRKQLGLLWRLADNTEPITPTDLVPENLKPLEPIPFEGQNSLPLFRMFQKVFYRTSDGRVAGYNNSPVGWLVGPGYYMVQPATPNVYIDYTQVPTEKPDDWPPIRKNEAGISNFVYGHMQDYLRRVYDLFLIGRATRKGKDTENYFVLVR
jgi:hypothetical protein